MSNGVENTNLDEMSLKKLQLAPKEARKEEIYTWNMMSNFINIKWGENVDIIRGMGYRCIEQHQVSMKVESSPKMHYQKWDCCLGSKEEKSMGKRKWEEEGFNKNLISKDF